MPSSLFDSALYRDLFSDAETATLLSDSAEIRALLLVEGALAKVQGARGVIPETAAAAIQRAAQTVQIDPAGLARETGQSGVPVPALIKAFAKAMEAPDHAQFLHFGATSQDIVDTALILRLRQMLRIWETRLEATLTALADLAESQAETPMAGRSWGQIATPTSFGAAIASWGSPLLRQLVRLAELRPRLLVVSLSGAAGTGAALGPEAAALRADLARALRLSDPGESWHSTRDRLAELAAWITQTAAILGKFGADLSDMARSERGEITWGAAGHSSTMPHKQNPVAPQLLITLGTYANAQNGVMQQAVIHPGQRDGAAWMGEWLALPGLCMALGRATAVAHALAQTIAPNPGAMARHIDGGSGLIYAEALSFALSETQPRPEAQANLKRLCAETNATGTPLADLLARDYPGRDWQALCTPQRQWGDAPAQARAFAAAVRAAR